VSSSSFEKEFKPKPVVVLTPLLTILFIYQLLITQGGYQSLFENTGCEALHEQLFFQLENVSLNM
jgi:hypothetical protein